MQLGGYFSGKLRHPLLWLLRMVLWLLSTWYGTFILCGRKSLSSQFPYFQRFSQVDVKRREEIVVNWSISYFYHIRILFRTMKFLVHLIFFTQVCILFWVKILTQKFLAVYRLCNQCSVLHMVCVLHEVKSQNQCYQNWIGHQLGKFSSQWFTGRIDRSTGSIVGLI